ncbi:MAG: CPBP family intramembrane metalloprotease [Methanobrevibacter sp.]|nr:CPBP family intramembrane metalloprotease [Methanobrevibacter sp.]
MADIDWFKFEDKDYDFPFYNKNPSIPKWGWIVLMFVFFFGFFLTLTQKIHVAILCCIFFIVPVLYFLKWDYKAIFRMPSRRDFALAIALFVGYMIYALVVSTILGHFGIVSSGTVEESSITVVTIVASVFTLMGEEFIKFIPFIAFLTLFYKFTNNRKLSVVVSVALVMLMFGAMHSYNWIMFVFALFIQGLGSLFEFYGYIKTKNILVSYITHLCTDLFIYSLVIFGMA